MPLVEFPVLLHGDPVELHLAECGLGGVDGPLQIGCEAEVEIESFLFHEFSGGPGLFPALLGELDIGPSGEKVEFVPFALSVSDQYQLLHFNRLGQGPNGCQIRSAI